LLSVSASSLSVRAARCAVVRVPAGWRGWIEAWLVSLRAAGRPDTTIRLRRYQLERVAEDFGPVHPGTVSGDALVAWMGSQDWQAETRRSWRSALRSFYGWAHASGRCNCDPSLALPPVKPSVPNPRPAPEDAYQAAASDVDERVRLMVRLAGELGLRRGEVARLHARDLERTALGWTLLVHGKGGRIRLLPIDAGLAGVIRRRGFGFVFPGNDHGHLSPHWVGKLVARALPAGWAMHSLRHRFGTVAYAQDRDLLTVQQLLGHVSPVTTQRYVQLPAESLRATVAAVARL